MGKITVETCEIEGLKIITPTVFGDARGYFMETYHYNDYKAAGIDVEFVQDNQSAAVKGVLRGLHFQKEFPQDKLVRVIRGEVYDVAVDLREGSPTFGQWHGVLLSEENKKQFFIPKNFAHGFLVLSDYAEFSYKCTDFYHPNDEGGLIYNDPEIGVEWPIPEGMELVMSEKDTKWGGLAAYKAERGLKKHMKITKKHGIALALTLGVVAAAIIIFHNNPGADPTQELVKKIISCVVILFSCIIFVKMYDKITVLPVELYQNRHLIWKLAKNDFKKRYAGSYLGAVWAMAQPVVTVAMYYVVFDVIMDSSANVLRSGVEIPFVLYLTAGLVPWFFFTEALTNGTNALLEYNYLVKKVVFKISILPIIKVIAASFIHVFFVCVLLIIAAIYGYYPSIYTLQLVYYSFCLFVFVLALSYTTCAVVVFFRDLSQIINIALQIGMWATPILWNMDALNGKWVAVLKLNPLVYVVNGYRSAIYEKQWFFQDFFSTMYFWIVTVVLFGIGALVFKRLKVHFADVL